MKQVLIVHGGSSFNSYDRYIHSLSTSPVDYERLKRSARWSESLSDQLSDTDILTPHFPNAQNAVYREWEIYFQKILPLLTGDVSLVGHSLGAMFLAKYLHKSPLKHPARQLILISPGYDDASNEDLGSFAISDATGLENSAQQIHLFHSQDDPVVPFTELAKFEQDLPSATSHIFKDNGHFLGPTFPELLEVIKQK